jgi:hypothetical protein
MLVAVPADVVRTWVVGVAVRAVALTWDAAGAVAAPIWDAVDAAPVVVLTWDAVVRDAAVLAAIEVVDRLAGPAVNGPAVIGADLMRAEVRTWRRSSTSSRRTSKTFARNCDADNCT